MTTKSVRWLALGSALLISTAALAQAPVSDARFAGSLASILAQAAKSAARMKADAAQAAVKRQALAALASRAQPDFAFTPGHLCTASDPNFKEYRYAEHIPYCQRNVTQQMKRQVAAHYGIAQSDWGNYEFDHLIPLAIGGDSSVDNLWPQPNQDNQGNDGKDHLELQLYLQMKAGTVSQADAVKQIYGWFAAAAAKGAE